MWGVISAEWRVTDIDGSSTKSISAQAFGKCKRTKWRLPAPGILDLFETNEKRVIHEGTRRTTKGHEVGRLCRIGRAAIRQAGVCSLEEQERLEEAPTRERGRPARMHQRCVPLGFPAMAHPATLPAGTAGNRPKQRPGAVAGRAGWRSWAKPCRCCAGGTPALPGGQHPVTSSQPTRSRSST